jgi:hypothetical protein
MIIPSKHSGYQAGIRLYPGGSGGDGGGGGDSGTGMQGQGTTGSTGLYGDSSTGSFTDAGGGGSGGGGLSTSSGSGFVSSGNGSSGLLGNGPGGLFGPVNTGGLSGYVDPSGASPVSFDGGGYGSDNTSNNSTIKPVNPTPVNPTPVNPTPVTPPPVNSNIYKSQYQNYARPTTQFSTSLYGTQPMNSPAFNSGMSRGNINQTIGNFYQTNPKGFNADASSVLDFMRSSGVNREDFQTYGGLNNYGPQMSMPQAQTQQPFNPYTNSSQQYNRFYGGQSIEYPQQQQYSPFGYQPQQQQYSPFSYGGGQQFVQPQMNNPFSYQPQQQQQFNQFRPGQSIEYPQQQQFNPYRQYETSLGSYNPYQQQQYNPYQQQQPQQQQYNPFSYQQPQPPPPFMGMTSPVGQQPQQSFGGYEQIQGQQASNAPFGSALQQLKSTMPTSSGPSQAIYGRSSGARGTPNVMRRAEGGIVGILKK